MLKISEVIKKRIVDNNGTFLANDNISNFINDGELTLLQKEVEEKISDVLQSLVIDVENDHNTKETAKRVAKMYLTEVFKGRYIESPKITDFPNTKKLDELYIVGPITIRSACSHHLVPIVGKVWVGVLPSDNVIGISKFNRLIDWIMSRPHIQEEAVIMIADELERVMKPKGIAVYMKAQHMCMTWRGVKEHETEMINSVMRGEFRDQNGLKAEFLSAVK